MSIVVPCSCGQKLAATPQMLGRMISCPKCGRMLTVSSSQGAATGGVSPDNSKLLVMVGIGAGTVLGMGVIALVVYLALNSRAAVPVAAAPAAATAPVAPGSPPSSTGASSAPIVGAAPAAPGTNGSQSPTPPPQSATPARNLVDVAPDFHMTPKEMGAAYKADPAVADAKYKGKVVEIECDVLQYSNSSKTQGSVTAANLEDLSSIFKCDIAEPDLWKKIAKRSKVKIKGVFRANYMESFGKFILENCVLTEIGPNPRLVLTTDEMSAEARADRPLFRHRFYEPELQVKGEVAGVEHLRGDSVRLVLKTAEAPRILVDTQSQSAEVEAALKRDFPVGTKVMFLGQYLDKGAAQPQTDIFLSGTVLKDE